MENQVAGYTAPQKKKSSKKVAVAIGAVLLLLLAGGFFIFGRSEQTSEQISPTPIEITEEPTPTEKPQIDKASVKIQILNGTGTPGQAGEVLEALTNAGYAEDQITTDNAEDYDHSVTTIGMQEGYEDIADDIKESLSGQFDSIEIESTPLEDSSEFHIIVTTGGETYVQPTKPATASASATLVPDAATTISPATTLTITPSPTLTDTP